MNIIIVGCGTVGDAICRTLVKEGHNITVIDKDAEALEDLANSCDVTGIIGNGVDVSLLRSAGAERADLLIAITLNDEINILSCLAAKKLGVKHSAARVRNPEYSEYIELMKSEMGLSFTINPELAAAKEIARVLRFPAASGIDTFAHGQVELAEFTVPDESPIAGQALLGLRESLGINFLICAVKRSDKVHIPGGNFVIESGDVLSIAAAESELNKFFKAAKGYKKPPKNVIIVGASKTTHYLSELLKSKGTKTNLTVIEHDHDKASALAENFSYNIIRADATKQGVLAAEGIEHADAFLALTDSDEENAIMSMYSSTFGVPKTVTMIRSLPYIDLFKNAGIETIISPGLMTVSYILRFVRGIANSQNASEIESLHKVMDDKTEALEFIVKNDVEGITGIPLKQLKKKSNTLLACIVRDGDIIIPSGEDIICRGDTVIVITQNTINSIKDIKL